MRGVCVVVAGEQATVSWDCDSPLAVRISFDSQGPLGTAEHKEIIVFAVLEGSLVVSCPRDAAVQVRSDPPLCDRFVAALVSCRALPCVNGAALDWLVHSVYPPTRLVLSADRHILSSTALPFVFTFNKRPDGLYVCECTRQPCPSHGALACWQRLQAIAAAFERAARPVRAPDVEDPL